LRKYTFAICAGGSLLIQKFIKADNQRIRVNGRNFGVLALCLSEIIGMALRYSWN
jgi:hypothetical protein